MLFTPAQIGEIALNNRILTAPMTRARADAAGNPGALHQEYYRQRASAGLIITEGTAPSPDGLAYPNTPAIFSPSQIAGWSAVTEAVHTAGGKIVLQVMHGGRISHPLNQPAGARVVGPSAIAADGFMHTKAGKQPFPVPEELTEEGILQVFADYAQAVRNARNAGFDGVELHAANGYLPNQFLSPNSNHRSDAYGGTIERRARFALELFDAMGQAWSAGRIGVRISPGGSFNDMFDDNPLGTYSYLARELSKRNPAYLHVVRPEVFAPAEARFDIWRELRQAFERPLIANGSLTATDAEELLAEGIATAVSFGRPYIANPDFAHRIRNGWPLAESVPARYYGSGAAGYIDYPAYELREAAVNA